MKKYVRIAPPNSLVLVLDSTNLDTDIPLEMSEQRIASTTSCIAIGTLSSQDGETDIWLADESLPRSDLNCVFSGILEITHDVSVCTIDLKPVISFELSKNRVKVEIWVNHPTEPNKIFIHVI